MATVRKPVVLQNGVVSRKEIVRFDRHQIVQHVLLMVTFILLAFTGLPMKFSTWAISQWWIGVWGGIDVFRAVHRFAAYAMIFDCLYHLVYIGWNVLVLKKPFPYKMVPSPKDFKDFAQEMAYFVGLSKERPKYDRFNWREKFDYWAIFWGMPVIGISGFIMMYPVLATRFLPGWVVPAAFVAHGDEAVLAVVWIFLVHLVFNHVAPKVFPFNKSIFTGRVSRERYKDEHPLEYERLVGPEEPAEAVAERPLPAPERYPQPAPEMATAPDPGERSEGGLRGMFSDAVVAIGASLVVVSVILVIVILAASLPGNNPYIGVFLFILLPVIALGGLLVFIFGVVMRGRRAETHEKEEDVE